MAIIAHLVDRWLRRPVAEPPVVHRQPDLDPRVLRLITERDAARRGAR